MPVLDFSFTQGVPCNQPYRPLYGRAVGNTPTRLLCRTFPYNNTCLNRFITGHAQMLPVYKRHSSALWHTRMDLHHDSQFWRLVSYCWTTGILVGSGFPDGDIPCAQVPLFRAHWLRRKELHPRPAGYEPAELLLLYCAKRGRLRARTALEPFLG